MRLIFAGLLIVFVPAAARSETLKAVRPGLMCADADALAALTRPDGSSRGDEDAAHAAIKSRGGCFDLLPGDKVTVLKSRHNTSIVSFGGRFGGTKGTYLVPNIDFTRDTDARDTGPAEPPASVAAADLPQPSRLTPQAGVQKPQASAAATNPSSPPAPTPVGAGALAPAQSKARVPDAPAPPTQTAAQPPEPHAPAQPVTRVPPVPSAASAAPASVASAPPSPEPPPAVAPRRESPAAPPARQSSSAPPDTGDQARHLPVAAPPAPMAVAAIPETPSTVPPTPTFPPDNAAPGAAPPAATAHAATMPGGSKPGHGPDIAGIQIGMSKAEAVGKLDTHLNIQDRNLTDPDRSATIAVTDHGLLDGQDAYEAYLLEFVHSRLAYVHHVQVFATGFEPLSQAVAAALTAKYGRANGGDPHGSDDPDRYWSRGAGDRPIGRSQSQACMNMPEDRVPLRGLVTQGSATHYDVGLIPKAGPERLPHADVTKICATILAAKVQRDAGNTALVKRLDVILFDADAFFILDTERQDNAQAKKAATDQAAAGNQMHL